MFDHFTPRKCALLVSTDQPFNDGFNAIPTEHQDEEYDRIVDKVIDVQSEYLFAILRPRC